LLAEANLRASLGGFAAAMDNIPGTILEEPRGAVYVALLDWMTVNAGSFSLVWQDQFSSNENAETALKLFGPFLIREERTNKWPGTTLYDDLAWVRYYRVEWRSIALLKSFLHALNGWYACDGPEDLAFYDRTGALILGSISHEHDSWVEDRFVPILSSALPKLRIA
jgi:hypothetical protein